VVRRDGYSTELQCHCCLLSPFCPASHHCALTIGAKAYSPSILSELYFPKVPVPSDHKFSPDWKGAAPYTAIIAPNGKILYFTQAGAMNPLEVRRALLKKLPDDRYLGQQAYWNSTF
jgi:hypothetical protein